VVEGKAGSLRGFMNVRRRTGPRAGLVLADDGAQQRRRQSLGIADGAHAAVPKRN